MIVERIQLLRVLNTFSYHRFALLDQFVKVVTVDIGLFHRRKLVIDVDNCLLCVSLSILIQVRDPGTTVKMDVVTIHFFAISYLPI